jgi:predicted DNA binding CopG/RHH family protein
MTEEEYAAWLESDEGERYLLEADWQPARFVLADPGLIPITIRLPKALRAQLRRLASAKGMGYQTLARQWLLERCAEEEAKEQRKAAGRKPRRAKSKGSHKAVNDAAG